jgi:glucan 1,3-beta-glucosidase
MIARVGNEGETGVVEISDLMFTTRGTTAGAVLMEWNVHEESQGSVAMFDTIFRVGGAMGTDLTTQNCQWTRKYELNDKYGCSPLSKT